MIDKITKLKMTDILRQMGIVRKTALALSEQANTLEDMILDFKQAEARKDQTSSKKQLAQTTQ